MNEAISTGDRNASLKRIGWLDLKRLAAAKVLVVGAGAIGNETLKNLALMSVGNIYVFDRDTIEMSNLARSVLYRASDCGQEKARVAAAALRDINPDIQVRWRRGDLETDLGEGLLREFDVVLGCVDGVYARYVLNQRCLAAGVPWVESGIGTLDGSVQVFSPSTGACYECGFGDAHYENAIGRFPAASCGRLAVEAAAAGSVPTTATIASIVGGIQVQECLKLLDYAQWMGRSLVSRQFYYSGTHTAALFADLPRREDCPAHDLAIDWAGNPPVRLTAASARMSAREFLTQAANKFDGPVQLSLDHEIVTGYSCGQCRHEFKTVLMRDRTFASALRCECGWLPIRDNDLSMIHTVSLNSQEHVLDASLIALGIPLAGIALLHGPNGDVKVVELAGDSSANYWSADR